MMVLRTTKCWVFQYDYIDNNVKVRDLVVSLENIETLHKELVISILN